MTSQKLLGIVCTVALVAGCNRSSTSTTRAGEEINSPRAQAEFTNNLTPTGRDTNRLSRIYPGDTNQLAPRQPDNTGVNKRDRSEDALTALDQGGSESDREISRNIRKGIMSKDELSTTAKNIKVITRDGKVTLRGPVKSEAEQKAIADVAKGVAGVSSVDNQLEVKSPPQ